MPPTTARTLLWLALLVLAAIAFSLGFACAVPLAALAAIAALTFTLPQALGLMLAVWLANQAIGFLILGYPHTAPTLAWGFIIGAIGLLATLAARPLAVRLSGPAALLACFAAAFSVYEGGLYLVSATLMGGTELYTAPVVARILELNAAAFVGLAVMDRLARTPRIALLPAARPA